ncbi:MAG TPA: hypothetical protein VK121_07880 [Pseudogracilibacillus sp.]|nr:hypothetical protein [Pseudogracilibacillus sp.]
MWTSTELEVLNEMFHNEEGISACGLKPLGWYLYSLWKQNDFKNEEIIYIKSAGETINYFFEYENHLYLLVDESRFWGRKGITLRKICNFCNKNEISANYIKVFIKSLEWVNQNNYFESEADELREEAHMHFIEMEHGLIEILRNRGYRVTD